MKKLKEWICYGNDCSKCKYCWEVKTSYEYDEYDCGCYIKGQDFDEKPCRLVKPIRFILGETIGRLSSRKANYYMSHEYDGFVEFAQDLDEKNSKMSELIMDKIIGDHVICWKDKNGELHECNTEEFIKDNAWEVRSGYEDFAHPIVHKKLSTEWKELIQKTCKSLYMQTIGRIIPYICG